MIMKRKRDSSEAFYEKSTKHWVQQQTGMPCLAEIVDSRSPPHASNTVEYYVHYCNFDKRLDEWVGTDRFLTPEQVREMGEQYFSDEPGLCGPLTRNLRRRFSDSFSSLSRHDPGNGNNTHANDGDVASALNSCDDRPSNADPVLQQLEREHEEATRVKNIQKITLGAWEIDCWYFSPFPEAYSHCDHLYFCERCLKYMSYEETLSRHRPSCTYRQGPPGQVIYLVDNLAVYELDGQNPSHKLYCQNLCLLAKLFLDHKTIYYDVAPFLFYVLCELVDTDGDAVIDDSLHPVGFFSKEKDSADNYNLACIMVLPPHQRKGYGRFLMSLSYEITRREAKLGSPEKPLSDLGLVSYQRFWGREVLLKLTPTATIESLSRSLGFTLSDITDTLERLGLLRRTAGKKPGIIYNARLNKELLTGKFALKPGQIELIPGALCWPINDASCNRENDHQQQTRKKRAKRE